MEPRLPVVLALALAFAISGCERWPVNTDCRWQTQARSARSAAGTATGRADLTADALRAEDLAIRYADAHFGRRSGHFESMAVYGRERDRCMATLFALVAEGHGVTPGAVRDALGQRPVMLDVMVMLSFAVLYMLAVLAIVGWLRRSLHAEGWPVMLPAVLAASLAVSGLGVVGGDVWSGLIESVRLGTAHLSNRAFRIPWQRHRLALFAAGVVLFWVVAALRIRRAGPLTRRFTVPSAGP